MKTFPVACCPFAHRPLHFHVCRQAGEAKSGHEGRGQNAMVMLTLETYPISRPPPRCTRWVLRTERDSSKRNFDTRVAPEKHRQPALSPGKNSCAIPLALPALLRPPFCPNATAQSRNKQFAVSSRTRDTVRVS